MRIPARKLFCVIGLALAASACAPTEEVRSVADPVIAENPDSTIYFGGDILTMEGSEPAYAEALVERGGEIAFVGSKATAFAKYGKGASLRDLHGQTLLPGFIDGHGHIYSLGLTAMMANVLPPPDGPGANYDSLVATTKAWMASDQGKLIIAKFGWIMASGYDDSQLAEGTHPTADVLDQISTEYPVMLIHQSGHLASVNNKGLAAIGFTKDTPDPKGGIIRRNADGTPNGVLEEAAFFGPIIRTFGKSDDELRAASIQTGQEAYAERGYTTAQEGRAMPDGTGAMAAAARNGKFFIDVVSYPDIVINKSAVVPEFYRSDRSYNNHYRIGGVKLTLDGSPQGKTAWLSHPYHVPPTGTAEGYLGYPVMSDEEAAGYVRTAFENKWQLLTHANGDAAIDQLLAAVKQAEAEFDYPDHRTVLIHGQTLRKDQIPLLKELRMYPSLFPMHTFYWGDWHVNSVLGHPRADYISPTRDVLNAGMTLTSHHDAPVTFPNAMRVLDATVNRVTRSGVVLGPDQRLTPYEGLKALTDWAAIQYLEESRKGTLVAGKLADFVILARNPLKIDPLTIKDIEVVATIKEGRTVYSNRGDRPATE
ncbi:MAG: amidohydrolase [Pontixanthobacter sp.]